MLTPAASVVLSASSELVPQDISPTSVAMEQKKSSLFIYPSNMQAVLLSAVQAEPPFQTNQQSLGDIFQNQWGLSFINEPSAGPETASRKPVDTKTAEVTFQGECPTALVSQGAETAPLGPDQPVFPKAYELDKRTSPQLLSGILKLGTTGEGGGFLLESHQSSGLRQAELGSPGAFVFLSKDYNLESRLASPTNSLLASAKTGPLEKLAEVTDFIADMGTWERRLEVWTCTSAADDEHKEEDEEEEEEDAEEERDGEGLCAALLRFSFTLLA